MAQRRSHPSARLRASPAHGAAHAGFDNETVETGLPLGLQEQGRGQGIISLEHGGSAGGRFSQQGRKFSGTNEDVLWRETEARKLFIVELSEPRPYALLDPEQACAAARSGRARGHASARKTGWSSTAS
jgi:hypothetical protein